MEAAGNSLTEAAAVATPSHALVTWTAAAVAAPPRSRAAAVRAVVPMPDPTPFRLAGSLLGHRRRLGLSLVLHVLVRRARISGALIRRRVVGGRRRRGARFGRLRILIGSGGLRVLLGRRRRGHDVRARRR